MADGERVPGSGSPERTFEQQTYDYARDWALSRRSLLKGGFALVGGAAIGLYPHFDAFAGAADGHLIVGRSAGSDTLDNHKSGSVASSEVQAQIYDPLAVIDPLTGEVHPSLALSWAFSNENKTVTFKLRPDVKFHDGTPFNAEAVKATIDRLLDPATASPVRFIVGPLEDVEVIDDLTVAYHYKQPFIGLWVGMLISYAAPHSPTAVKTYGDQFGRHPVGTGPFRFVSWDSNDVIRLERNPDRNWASPIYKNPGAAWINSIEYRTIPESATRIASLLSGEIDLIAGAGAVPLDKVRQLRQSPGVTLVSQPALGSHGIVFAQNRPAMSDVRVRRAICHAMDREKVLVFALDGNGRVATSPLASSYSQFDPKTAEYGFAHAPDKARALLAEAGHADGLSLSYLGVDDNISRAIGEILQADLAAIGVKLTLNTLPNAEYSALRGKGEHDLVYMTYSYADADIVNFLFAKGSGLNVTQADNPRLDELVHAQRAEFDSDKRRDLIHEVQQITVGDAYWLPIVEGVNVAASRDNVSIRLTASGQLIANDVKFE